MNPIAVVPRARRSTVTAATVAALLSLIALVAMPRALAAQAVRGTVQDAAKRPVSGVVLSLLDSTNTVVARALSDERGEFRMLAPRSGTVRIRGQRIGYVSTLSAPMVLEAGATSSPVVTLEGTQVQLATVRVVANSSCGRTDAGDAALLAVWEQAQTGLAASLLTSGTRGLLTSVMNVQRVLDPRGKLLEQQLGMRAGNMTAPWAAIPIDTLRRRGYVWIDRDNALTYNAPGIDGFVSPQFLDDHCFRLVASKDTTEIGVAFEPSSARMNKSEIRGTMWVNRRSAELTRTEFSYTAIPGVPESPVPGGGSMRFSRLPNGAVIIESWELRMPVTTREQFRGTRTRVDQIQTTGGMVVAIRRGADTLFKRPLVTVAGVVRDSVSGRPHASAVVKLAGTQNATRTAADGRFELRDVLPGNYTLAVATLALDSMRASVGTDVMVRDSLPPLVIRVPTAAQVAQNLCGANFSAKSGTGALFGTVTFSGTTEGLGGISVAADWTERSTVSMNLLTTGQGRRLATKTDASGAYRLCGVPLETALTVRAFPATGKAAPQTVRMAPTERFATVALGVDRAATAVATFRGTVVADSVNTPVANADVIVGTGDRAVRGRTDATGAFRIDDVPVGAQEVSVRRLGFTPTTATVTFAANDEEERRVVLSPLTVLDSVAIIADRPPARLVEFEEHRRLGLGYFLGRAELEKMDGQSTRIALSNARQMVFAGGRYPMGSGVQKLRKDRDDGSCKHPNALSPPLQELGGAMICGCFPVVYLDGVVQSGSPTSEPFDLLSFPVNQLEAVEWYVTPATIPGQYNRFGAPCGVLVLHTRRPGESRKPPGHF
jgi:hypothetical protein